MRQRREFLKGTAAAVAGVTLAPGVVKAAQAGPSYTFKMATGWSGGPLMDIGAKAFAERLEFLSGGRMKVQVFPGGALGNALKVSETVRNGIAEMGHTWMGYDWGADPTTVLFGGYAGSFNSEYMLHWLYEAGGADLQRQFRDEKFGVISMPLFIRTAEVFLHSRKPVKTLADLKGLKLRTAGAWIEMAKELGASPVTTPGGEIYPALERGVIDATEWGTLWENITPGFYKVAKYLIIPGVHQPTAPFELCINKDVWGKLSAGDKKLIELTAKLVTFETFTRIGHEDAKALEFYRKHGNEIVELDEEVQYAARERGLAWAEKTKAGNPWFEKVYKSQREFEVLWKDAPRYRNVKVKQA
ncbi:MAG: C4-dicarboxylate ABC transporter substrate-binding protein [Azospira oryzae]|nr:MAG: C4-dicarboxylate ABC transporter substrate-binding protein [Azospira oryzae]PZP76426.1 MAG: C4-dicarboxylate ABC transporter substrate-binding protein [Azospira oryzae]